MQINEPNVTQMEAPLWRLAFRAGFLLASVFAVVAMVRWMCWVLWPAHWDFALSPVWWHAHEMIFGFAMPVVAGFLLSAVVVWTGVPGTKGWRLKILFGLWLLARIILWVWPALAPLAWLAEMLFITLLGYELTKRVWALRQWRNMLFLPILLILALFSSLSYGSLDAPVVSARLHYGAVWMITLLVVIIGGRVIPLFTGNRLDLKLTSSPLWFEYLTMAITAVIGVVSAIWSWQELGPLMPLLCFAGAGIHLIRLFRWQGWKVFGVPLLWSMHLSYLCIPLTMLGLAITGGNQWAIKNLIHLLAIGAIGGMILTMMARVSLGHTGRPLEVPTYIAVAFALLFLAAILRAFLPLVDIALTPWAWRLSAGLWIIAFSLFLVRYLPMLMRARVDGKPG